MRVLITGIAGFVGSHFVEFLSSSQPDVEVHGAVLPKPSQHAFSQAHSSVTFHDCDFNDKVAVRTLLEQVKPDRIFHLAAQSYVNSSWENPELTLHTNIIGQSNLLEAVRGLRNDTFDPVVVIAGSSEEYGPARQGGEPFTEASDLRPLSPYAISKLAQDFMGLQYHAAYGVKAIRLRCFNHTGPRRDPVFGVSNFAKKIAEIEKGQRKPELLIRDLSAVRDFTDVRDVVRAYWLAAEKCVPGEVYNVSSGRGLSFKTMLDRLLDLARVKPIVLIPDPTGPRPTDGGIITGDNRKFTKATGWQPQIDFIEQTLPDMLEYWRQAL